jgi:ribosomal protein L19E
MMDETDLKQVAAAIQDVKMKIKLKPLKLDRKITAITHSSLHRVLSETEIAKKLKR